MNLYKISQDTNTGWDTYSDAVVIAETEEEARHIHPDADYVFKDGQWHHSQYGSSYAYNMWTEPSEVTVQLIGYLADNVDLPRVVCASFHAG